MLLITKDAFYFSSRSWLGQLRLYFELCHGRSILVKRWHCGPFYVQKPFYYEENVPHVYLLHPPGGLVGGDQLSLFVSLGSGSQVLLTMPGSSKFYRSNGSYVYLQQRFNLSKNSVLEWLPQSNIFFSHAKVIMDNIFVIDEGARCICFEMFCFGCLSLKKEFTKGILNIFLSVFLKNSFGLKERIRVDCFNDSVFNKFGGYSISAMLFATPGDINMLDDVRVLIAKHNVAVGGATLLEDLLVVRLLGNNDEQIRIVLRNLWCFLRPSIVGKQSVIPRIWLT